MNKGTDEIRSTTLYLNTSIDEMDEIEEELDLTLRDKQVINFNISSKNSSNFINL
jgi:hypothetical protein